LWSELLSQKKKNPNFFSLSLFLITLIIEEVSFLANTEGESINPQSAHKREESEREREKRER
jgi:hypothetical protein